MSKPDLWIEDTVEVSVPLAWVLMLALGDMHLDVDSQWPHPGYWATLIVTLAVLLVVRCIRWAVSS